MIGRRLFAMLLSYSAIVLSIPPAVADNPPIPAGAQQPAAPQAPASWIDDGVSDPRHAGADIRVPRNPPGLTLFELKDTLGNGLDTAAQYGSADTGVTATVFIYAPSVPDGSSVVAGSTNVILQRFKGAKIERDEGATTGVRRIVYGGDAGQSVNALAVARRGPWMVTIRVTGSEFRRRETLAAFDSLIDAILPAKAQTQAKTADWVLPTACTSTDERPDAPVRRASTVDAMMEGTIATVAGVDDPKLRMPWPAAHIGEYCVDRAAPGLPSIVLRGAPAREGNRSIGYLVLLGDAGAMLEVGHVADPGTAKQSPIFARLHLVDRINVVELYDGWPSRTQLDALLTNMTAAVENPIVSVKRDRPGIATTIELNQSRLTDRKPAP